MTSIKEIDDALDALETKPMVFEIGRVINYSTYLDGTEEDLNSLNQVFELLDKLEPVIGDHPSYTPARGELNEILFDLVGSIDEKLNKLKDNDSEGS